jgi:hypothetical protein
MLGDAVLGLVSCGITIDSGIDSGTAGATFKGGLAGVVVMIDTLEEYLDGLEWSIIASGIVRGICFD